MSFYITQTTNQFRHVVCYNGIPTVMRKYLNLILEIWFIILLVLFVCFFAWIIYLAQPRPHV